MRFLLAVALIATGILGVEFILQGTFATSWPLALVPIAAWIVLYLVLRLLIVLVALGLVIAAIAKVRREFPGESLNESAERVRNRGRKAATPRDLFHD